EQFRDALGDGENGFLAVSEAEWLEKIRSALDPVRARALGEQGRATVLARFSFAAHRGRLTSLLHPLVGVAAGPSPKLLPLDPALRGLGPVARLRRNRDIVREQWHALRGAGPRGTSTPMIGCAGMRPLARLLDPTRAEAVLDAVARYGPSAVRTRGRVVLA